MPKEAQTSVSYGKSEADFKLSRVKKPFLIPGTSVRTEVKLKVKGKTKYPWLNSSHEHRVNLKVYLPGHGDMLGNGRKGPE